MRGAVGQCQSRLQVGETAGHSGDSHWSRGRGLTDIPVFNTSAYWVWNHCRVVAIRKDKKKIDVIAFFF